MQRPTADKLAALAKALNVPMEAIVSLNAPVQPNARRHARQPAARQQLTTQLVKVVPQLDPEDQRALLKQAKLMLLAKESQAKTKRPRKVA